MPLVNVLFITYNHAQFVAKALDSILAQKTNFEFKIIIGDDCSKDGTRAIVEEYAKNHPDRIQLSNPEKNLGPSKNYIQLFEKCENAKYTAYLEGDDYWTDNLKLQKQVDILEANPQYNICFHNVDVLSVNEKGEEVYIPYNSKTKPELGFDDLIIENPIATGSCVFRNKIFTSEVFKNTEPYDDFFHLLYLQNSKAFFLNEKMGVYRQHQGGTWSNLSAIKRHQKNIRIRKMINQYFFSLPQYKHYSLFYAPIATNYKAMADICYLEKQKTGFIKSSLNFLYYAKKAGEKVSYMNFIKKTLKMIFSK